MQKYSRIERFARRLLLLLSYAARLLGILPGRFERRRMIVQPRRRRWQLTAIALRVVITLTFMGTVPQLFEKYFLNSPASYVRLLGRLQAHSVSAYALLAFVLQTRGERYAIAVLNRFMRLYERIAAMTQKGSTAPHMLRGKFVALLLLKLTLTAVGFACELPSLLPDIHCSADWWELGTWISSLFSVYLWLGSILVLDISVLGFVVIAEMYGALGDHLRHMLSKMECIEWVGREQLSRYNRMQLLCEHADNIDAVGRRYAELYALARHFHHIFQWPIVYYIYYNFVIVLQLLHQSIWLYIHEQLVAVGGLGMVAVKIGNITLLILCADHALRQSRLPEHLPLDIACSGIDVRWDESVETFLSQRVTENLEFKVLGFFRLNNGLILMVLSAIIAYLFVLIQFGLSGAFEENGLIVKSLDSRQSLFLNGRQDSSSTPK